MIPLDGVPLLLINNVRRGCCWVGVVVVVDITLRIFTGVCLLGVIDVADDE